MTSLEMSMNEKDWVAEIINPVRTLNNLYLLLDDQEVAIRRDRQACRITFPASFEEADTVPAKLAFGSLDEYLLNLRRRAYSALLIDGSFVQMSIDVVRGDLVKHRYAYYPCPISFKNGELEMLRQGASVVEIIEVFLRDQPAPILLRSPLRFDFDEDEPHGNTMEPHAHIHFNHADCRCAVSAPIYPGYFIKFFMRHFYPHIWNRCPELGLLSQDMIGFWLREKEEQFLHFTAKKGAKDRS